MLAKYKLKLSPMKRVFTPFILTLCLTSFLFSQEQKAEKKPTLELKRSIEIKELNNSDEADCYPFITEDGLRLYYTNSEEIDHIVFSKRKSLNDAFEKPQKVKLEGNDSDVLSCWLTADELSIFYVVRKSNFGASTTLMRGTRNSVKEDFKEFTKIELKGKISGNLFGPSLTPDLGELYFYNSADNQRILKFKKLSSDSYELVESLPIQDGLDVSPGQLSKDGLKYYFAARTNENFSQMAYYERKSLNDKFEEITWMKKDPNLAYIGQFSDALKGKFIFYKISTSNSWEENELYFSEVEIKEQDVLTGPDPIVEEMSEVEEEMWDFEDEFFSENDVTYTNEEVEDEEQLSIELLEKLEVYPNPTTSILMIKGFTKDEEILIVDIQGKVVFEGLSSANSVDVSNLTTGRYFIHFTERPESESILFEKK